VCPLVVRAPRHLVTWLITVMHVPGQRIVPVVGHLCIEPGRQSAHQFSTRSVVAYEPQVCRLRIGKIS
jgi:hypothetical protein